MTISVCVDFSLSSAILESTLKYWFSVLLCIATAENHRPGDVLTTGSPFNEGVIVQVLGMQPLDSPQQAASSGIACHYHLLMEVGLQRLS